MSRPPSWALYGVTEAGPARLSSEQKLTIKVADKIYADARFHSQIVTDGQILDWPRPFSGLKDQLQSEADKKIVFLATGDPLWYGAGQYLIKHFELDAFTIEPNISGLQFAAARMGWSQHEIEIISLHGRPLSDIIRGLYPRAKCLVIPANGAMVPQLAALLVRLGWADATITILSHLGSPKERRYAALAHSFAGDSAGGVAGDSAGDSAGDVAVDFSGDVAVDSAGDKEGEAVPDFHILAIDLGSQSEFGFIAGRGCLPDKAFETDGQMTKFEARSVALSRLMPHPHGVLWDLGCGSGTISIEWLRLALNGSAYGIDRKEGRLNTARLNADNLGVSHLNLQEQDNEAAIESLPDPDAIFIGGGLTKALLLACIERLAVGGRLVAHAVTLESEQILVSHKNNYGGELVKLTVHHAEAVGRYSGWRGLMPVTHYYWQKTKDHPHYIKAASP